MSSTLFSQDWYRIAELKPRVRDHITVHTHRYRGKRWYLAEDHLTGQVRRLTPQSYLLFGLMDGRRSVDELWDIASQRLGEEIPTHEEVLQLLGNLYQANLIRMDISGDIAELFERGADAKRKRWLGKLKSPLSIQIPLVDPDRFFSDTLRYVSPVFTRFGLVIVLASLFGLLFLVGKHWSELTSNVIDNVLAADNLFLLWLIYPAIKLLHELGHGYCVKRNGGEVHQLGIMLLVLLPMPYVDASATNAFADKKQRMLVGMAGIIVELMVAFLAMLVWTNAEAGLAKSIAFNIMFLAGLSTVLVNGNPLLRFDGYYVLADFLEIPNLAQRASKYWGWLLKRVLFGVVGHESPAFDRREALWLFSYGIGALLYRMFLMVTIFLFVAQKYFVIGVLLATWSVVGTMVWPTLKTLGKTWGEGGGGGESRNPKIVMPVVAATLAALLCLMPLPLSTTVEGVVQVGDEHRVFTGESCFVEELHVAAGQTVNRDDLLLTCSNPRLEADKAILDYQRAEALAQRQGVWDDPVQIKIYDEEIQKLNDEIAVNQRQLDALRIHAPSAGTWWLKQSEDLLGRYIARGALVGNIVTASSVRVMGMIPESQISLVRERAETAKVVKASNLRQPFSPSEWRVFPSSSKQLVSAVLSEGAGGDIIVDPAEAEPRSLQQYFWVDLGFDSFPLPKVDERVFVKFEHPPEALIYRTYRIVRRTFLQYFNV